MDITPREVREIQTLGWSTLNVALIRVGPERQQVFLERTIKGFVGTEFIMLDAQFQEIPQHLHHLAYAELLAAALDVENPYLLLQIIQSMLQVSASILMEVSKAG